MSQAAGNQRWRSNTDKTRARLKDLIIRMVLPFDQPITIPEIISQIATFTKR